MSTTSQGGFDYGEVRNGTTPHERNAGEATLRLIAQFPAPDGLERRVLNRLRSRPAAGRVLEWPRAPRLDTDWKRTAAAAAIALVVAGGGWGIYWNARPMQAGETAAPQVRPSVNGGFSSAGAIRTPQTLKGLVAVPEDQAPHPPAVPARKATAPVKQAPPAAAPARTPSDIAGQPSVTVAK